MLTNQNNQTPMNKNFIIILIVAVVAVGGIWLLQKGKLSTLRQSKAPSAATQPQASLKGNDTTSSITQDLNSIDTGSTLDQQFQTVDQDINVL